MQWRGVPVAVRRNRRAKQVWIKVRPGKGIEVVLPYQVFGTDVPTILDRHQSWIADRLAELAARGEAPGQDLVPRTVALPFLGREFTVLREEARRPELHADAATITLHLQPEGEETGVLLLQRWLVLTGKRTLTPLCRSLAAETNVFISGVTIRNQASRWGSCSVADRISLNAKLLFLPKELARHVVLHELCHIAHRNHGPYFWARLREVDPLTDMHETQLRHAWSGLPAWSKWRP